MRLNGCVAMMILAAGGTAISGQARVLQSPAQLSAGKTLVRRLTLNLKGQPFEKQIDTVYATKIGNKHPDQMYIVSGHMDSVNGDSRDQASIPSQRGWE